MHKTPFECLKPYDYNINLIIKKITISIVHLIDFYNYFNVSYTAGTMIAEITISLNNEFLFYFCILSNYTTFATLKSIKLFILLSNILIVVARYGLSSQTA